MSPRRAKAVSGRVGDDPATALREHLIDAAERLLSERQVSTITTRDIARTAKVSDGVLYNYFADKNALLLAALTRRYAQILARFVVNLPEPGTRTVEENLLAYLHAALDLIADTLPISAGLLSEPDLLHGFIAAIHREPFHPRQVLHPIGDYISGEQRLGRIGPVDVGAAVTLLFGAPLVLAVSELIGGRTREEVAAELPALVRVLVRGLSPS